MVTSTRVFRRKFHGSTSARLAEARVTWLHGVVYKKGARAKGNPLPDFGNVQERLQGTRGGGNFDNLQDELQGLGNQSNPPLCSSLWGEMVL